MKNETLSADMVINLLLPATSDVPYRGLFKRMMYKTSGLNEYAEGLKTMLMKNYNMRSRDLNKLSNMQLMFLHCFLEKFFDHKSIEKFMDVKDIMEKLNLSEALFDKYPEEKFDEICDKILKSK